MEKSAAFEAGIADSMQKTALTQRGIMKALARSKAKPERLLEWGSKMEKKHLGRLQGTELGKHYKDPDEWIHKVPKGMSQAGYEAAQKHVGQTGFAGRQATELAHMRKPNVLESARAQHQATAAAKAKPVTIKMSSFEAGFVDAMEKAAFLGAAARGFGALAGGARTGAGNIARSMQSGLTRSPAMGGIPETQLSQFMQQSALGAQGAARAPSAGAQAISRAAAPAPASQAAQAAKTQAAQAVKPQGVRPSEARAVRMQQQRSSPFTKNPGVATGP